jgi:hypothetical protein
MPTKQIILVRMVSLVEFVGFVPSDEADAASERREWASLTPQNSAH